MFMKKVLISFIIIALLSLCSCRKVNEDTPTESNNTSDISSNYSYTTSDAVPTERDESTDGQQDSNENSYISNQESDSSDITLDKKYVSLAMDILQPYHINTSKKIQFILYNEKKNIFTYNTDFFLQIYLDDNWEYYPTKDGKIEYKLDTELSKTSQELITFNLEDKYDLPLLCGSYRIIQEIGDNIIVSPSFEVINEGEY